MFVACFKIIKQLISEESVMVGENFSKSTEEKKYRISFKAVWVKSHDEEISASHFYRAK